MLTHVKLDYDQYPFALSLNVPSLLFILQDIKLQFTANKTVYLTSLISSKDLLKLSFSIDDTTILLEYTDSLLIPILTDLSVGLTQGYVLLRYVPKDRITFYGSIKLSLLTVTWPVFNKSMPKLIQEDNVSKFLLVANDGIGLQESSDSQCDYYIINSCAYADPYDFNGALSQQTIFMDKVNYIQPDLLVIQAASDASTIFVDTESDSSTIYVYISTSSLFLGCIE